MGLVLAKLQQVIVIVLVLSNSKIFQATNPFNIFAEMTNQHLSFYNNNLTLNYQETFFMKLH